MIEKILGSNPPSLDSILREIEKKEIEDLKREEQGLGSYDSVNPAVWPWIAQQCKSSYKDGVLISRNGGEAYAIKCRDDIRGTDIVIKIFRKTFTVRSDSRHRILRTIKTQEQLSRVLRKSIVPRVIDFDESSFLSMPFVDGENILNFSTFVNDESSRFKIWLAIAEGVEEFHQYQFIHTDLKPENVYVTRRDGKLLPVFFDWGSSKRMGAHKQEQVTIMGDCLASGTWGSTEQITGNAALRDYRSDIQALGYLMSDIMSQKFPVMPIEEDGTFYRAYHHHDLLPENLRDVYEKATADDKQDRYRRVKFFIQEAKRAAEQDGIYFDSLKKTSRTEAPAVQRYSAKLSGQTKHSIVEKDIMSSMLDSMKKMRDKIKQEGLGYFAGGEDDVS